VNAVNGSIRGGRDFTTEAISGMEPLLGRDILGYTSGTPCDYDMLVTGGHRLRVRRDVEQHDVFREDVLVMGGMDLHPAEAS
jgi:hypothetical protein